MDLTSHNVNGECFQKEAVGQCVSLSEVLCNHNNITVENASVVAVLFHSGSISGEKHTWQQLTNR